MPIVLRDLDRWLQTEGPEVLRASERDDLALRSGGSLARNASLRAIYAASRAGDLQEWWRKIGAELRGEVLEIGAGLGSLGDADVVALDTNYGLLRAHPSARRVCGDAADPPFLAGTFDAVALPNVLDSCSDPGVVLAQADALLRPGGQLIVSCAYAFQDDITPAAARFGPADLLAGLAGERAFLGYALNYTIVAEHDAIAWPLVVSSRTTHVHRAQAIVARKR